MATTLHQDLSGRENIFMNGAMLGMTRAEIRQQFDAIVDFAGVDRFLDTPVTRYSSGMYVRLAFAVAAHLQSEILIVDEVLAVGDAEFQAKCLGKMRDISGDGRTVLFVSHNMHSVALLCDRAIVLQSGRAVFSGEPQDAIDLYSQQTTSGLEATEPSRRIGSGEYRFTNIASDKQIYSPDESKRITFALAGDGRHLGRFYPSTHLIDERGYELAQMDGRLVGCWFEDGDNLRGELVINGPWLRPGRYHLDLNLCTEGAIVDSVSHACGFEVNAVMPYPSSAGDTASTSGLVLADYRWAAASADTSGGAERAWSGVLS